MEQEVVEPSETNKNFYVPTCCVCGSKQIRTTKLYRICNRCGNREKI